MTLQASPTAIEVQVFADVICPWCYIGKKRLDAAFEARHEITPNYVWRTFLLNPSMPREGMDRNAYLSAKFGHSAQAVYGRIAAAGLDSGIEFKFDDIATTPDSRPAHRLLLEAGDKAAEVSELLYQAYFLHGLDIGNTELLERIAADAGIDFDAKDMSRNPQLENDLAEAQRLGLDGVPYFVFGGKYAVAGAHLPEHLIPAIDAVTAGTQSNDTKS